MSNFNQDCSIERIQSISISGFLRDMNLLRKLVNAGVDNTKILTIFKECENLKQNVLRTFIMSSFGGLDENSAKLWYNVVNNSALFREMTTKDTLLKGCLRANNLINNLIMMLASNAPHLKTGTEGSGITQKVKDGLEYSKTDDMSGVENYESFGFTKLESETAGISPSPVRPKKSNLEVPVLADDSKRRKNKKTKNPRIYNNVLVESERIVGNKNASLNPSSLEVSQRNLTPQNDYNHKKRSANSRSPQTDPHHLLQLNTNNHMRSGNQSSIPHTSSVISVVPKPQLGKSSSNSSLVMKSVESEDEMEAKFGNPPRLGDASLEEVTEYQHDRSDTLHDGNDESVLNENEIRIKSNEVSHRSHHPSNSHYHPGTGQNSANQTYVTNLTKDTYLSSQLDGDGCGFFGYQRIGSEISDPQFSALKNLSQKELPPGARSHRRTPEGVSDALGNSNKALDEGILVDNNLVGMGMMKKKRGGGARSSRNRGPREAQERVVSDRNRSPVAAININNNNLTVEEVPTLNNTALRGQQERSGLTSTRDFNNITTRNASHHSNGNVVVEESRVINNGGGDHNTSNNNVPVAGGINLDLGALHTTGKSGGRGEEQRTKNRRLARTTFSKDLDETPKLQQRERERVHHNQEAIDNRGVSNRSISTKRDEKKRTKQKKKRNSQKQKKEPASSRSKKSKNPEKVMMVVVDRVDLHNPTSPESRLKNSESENHPMNQNLMNEDSSVVGAIGVSKITLKMSNPINVSIPRDQIGNLSSKGTKSDRELIMMLGQATATTPTKQHKQQHLKHVSSHRPRSNKSSKRKIHKSGRKSTSDPKLGKETGKTKAGTATEEKSYTEVAPQSYFDMSPVAERQKSAQKSAQKRRSSRSKERHPSDKHINMRATNLSAERQKSRMSSNKSKFKNKRARKTHQPQKQSSISPRKEGSEERRRSLKKSPLGGFYDNSHPALWTEGGVREKSIHTTIRSRSPYKSPGKVSSGTGGLLRSPARTKLTYSEKIKMNLLSNHKSGTKSTYDIEKPNHPLKSLHERLYLFPGLDQNKDYSIAMKNQYEGCAVNFDGKVLRFRLDKSSGEMEFQSRFKFMIKDKEYKESEIGFKDIIYYKPLNSYILFDIKGSSFKFWLLRNKEKTINFIRESKYSKVKFAKFFSKSINGQILYLNYFEFGIHVISPKSKRFRTFEPYKVLPPPDGHCYVDVCPLSNKGIVMVSDLGAICYYDSNLEGIASYQLNLIGSKHSKEYISCMGICPNDQHLIIMSYITVHRSKRKYNMYWLKMPEGGRGGKFSFVKCHSVLSESDKEYSYDAVKSVKFHRMGTLNRPLFYLCGDKDVFLSYYLEDGAVRRFKSHVNHRARSYKIEAMDKDLWTCDSAGNICKLELVRKEG